MQAAVPRCDARCPAQTWAPPPGWGRGAQCYGVIPKLVLSECGVWEPRVQSTRGYDRSLLLPACHAVLLPRRLHVGGIGRLACSLLGLCGSCMHAWFTVGAAASSLIWSIGERMRRARAWIQVQGLGHWGWDSRSHRREMGRTLRLYGPKN
jgi:hypothetical protein